MGKLFFSIAALCLSGIAMAQNAQEIVARVKKSQQQISTASYKVIRQDTFVTGTTRRSSGEVKIKALPSDAIFGFAYWGRRDGIARESVYDGKMIFDIDHEKKAYESSSSASMIEHSLGSPGGQMVVTDLVRLDTSHAQQLGLRQDERYYYLSIMLPDIKEYDVFKRVKTVTIDKKNLLPVAVRSRQETLGKVQDICYELSDLKINETETAYDFASERVPAGYTRKVAAPNKKLNSLVGSQMPMFVLNDFDEKPVASENLMGKLVLLDFWEVWCGPCVASMPKVQELEKKYAGQGLAIYGVMSEKEQLEVAKTMIKKRQISFPMLQSDAEINKIFGVSAVPTYILVDRKGTVRFISEGFSEQLEKEIQRLL